MTMRRVLAAAIGGVMVAIAGVAVAANYSSSSGRNDFFAPGKHQFYVWCANGDDYMATETGKNAEDAQMKLYDANKAAGKSTCWPVWQGRLPA